MKNSRLYSAFCTQLRFFFLSIFVTVHFIYLVTHWRVGAQGLENARLYSAFCTTCVYLFFPFFLFCRDTFYLSPDKLRHLDPQFENHIVYILHVTPTCVFFSFFLFCRDPFYLSCDPLEDWDPQFKKCRSTRYCDAVKPVN